MTYFQSESVRSNWGLLQGGVASLESVLRVHHLSKALHQMCRKDCTREDKDLLVEASRLVVRFVLGHYESITADRLWPSFSFGVPVTEKLFSDIEAKAEILNTSVERLQLLGAYDESLKERVDEGDRVIQACRVLNDASRAWLEGRVADACDLLDEVRQLAPHEPELESLYNRWISIKEHFADPRSPKTAA